MSTVSSKNAAVILFPGSNCDQETVAWLAQYYKTVDVIWHRDHFESHHYDFLVLPGGFSYGDYIRAGACASRSPVMSDVRHFANRGGTVMGICNGFQILTESQLLPGVLLRSQLGRFDCRYVSLKKYSDTCLSWTIPDQVTLPIANTFGRFYVSQDQIKRLKDQGQIVYTYESEVHDGVAAVTNEQGNVMGMMPHPERAWAPHHTNQIGMRLLPTELLS